MSKLRVNDVLGEDGVSAVGFSKGAVVTGVCTATTFSGNLTGSSSGLTGTPNITINNLTGVAATFTGDVAIGGTLTYEDVVNIDSVGLITARTGVRVTAGGVDVTAGGVSVANGGGNVVVGTSGTITNGSNFHVSSNALKVIGTATVVGEFVGTTQPTIQLTQQNNSSDLQLRANSTGGLVRTATDKPLILGSNQAERVEIGSSGRIYFKSGPLVEKSNNHSSATLSSLQNDGHVNLLSGNVIKFTGNETDSTCTINFRGNGSTTLASLVSTGDNVAVTVILDPNGTGLITAINIDGHAQTIEWSGGSAPTAGAASSWDIYSINLFRTGSGNTDWLVTASCTNYA